MPTAKERLSILLNRNGFNTEITDKIASEICKGEDETIDLESLITDFDNESEKVVSSKKTFQEKYIKPKVDEEKELEFKAIRGTILQNSGLNSETIKKILENSEKKFAATMINLIESITQDKANFDDLSKSQIAELKAKETQLSTLLEQNKEEVEKYKNKSQKAELNYKKKGIMLKAYNKLIPIITADADFMQDTVFSKVEEQYDIDPETGALLIKGTEKYAFKQGTGQNLQLSDVMYDILEKGRMINKSTAGGGDDKRTTTTEQKPDNTGYFKNT